MSNPTTLTLLYNNPFIRGLWLLSGNKIEACFPGPFKPTFTHFFCPPGFTGPNPKPAEAYQRTTGLVLLGFSAVLCGWTGQGVWDWSRYRAWSPSTPPHHSRHPETPQVLRCFAPSRTAFTLDPGWHPHPSPKTSLQPVLTPQLCQNTLQEQDYTIWDQNLSNIWLFLLFFFFFFTFHSDFYEAIIFF